MVGVKIRRLVEEFKDTEVFIVEITAEEKHHDIDAHALVHTLNSLRVKRRITDGMD